LKSIVSYLVSFFIVLSVWSCAQRGRPDGGPKDTEPPQFISAKPQNYSINYQSNEIVIKFDEYVKLDNPRQQIIISPPLAHKPNITPQSVPSKEFSIEVPRDSLLENTTYTINFGTSIADNNEGNVLPYFKYVFSTGNELDSLQLSGQVFDAFNRVPDKTISVMLHRLDSSYTDSTVFKKPPTYIAYTDSASAFTIENIKAGQYKLFAIKDANANYKFDADTDKIGFLDDTISIPTEKAYDLFVFKDVLPFKANRPQQISRLQLEFGYQGALSNPDIHLISTLPDSVNFDYRILKHPEKDTLQYWYKPYIDQDSLLFAFKNAGQLVDTLEINPKEIEVDSLRISSTPKSTIGFLEELRLSINTPIAEVDETKLNLMNQDSTTIAFTSTLNKVKNRLEINFEKQEKSRYSLNILPGAITDFYQTTNDTINLNLNTASYADFGNLELSVEGIKRFPVIGELVTETGEVVMSHYKESLSPFNFRYIAPGNYYFRLIYDDNANGQWDSGNYLKSQQAEPVFYEPEPFEIRAFFDYVKRISLN
jgi:hypothetical protein